MRIDEYLETNRIPVKTAAKEIGISRVSLWRIINGKQHVSRKTMDRIIYWSGGAITPNSIYLNGSAHE